MRTFINMIFSGTIAAGIIAISHLFPLLFAILTGIVVGTGVFLVCEVMEK